MMVVSRQSGMSFFSPALSVSHHRKSVFIFRRRRFQFPAPFRIDFGISIRSKNFDLSGTFNGFIKWSLVKDNFTKCIRREYEEWEMIYFSSSFKRNFFCSSPGKKIKNFFSSIIQIVLGKSLKTDFYIAVNERFVVRSFVRRPS